MPDLFSPLRIADLQLPNRMVAAPMTRCRAEAGHVPGELMARYYAQRASAGLLIAEATMVEEGNAAFGGCEPGIYNAAQIAGWRRVTEAVHGAGGRIVLQLWHGGRACHSLLNGGRRPVGPSPLAIEGDQIRTPQGLMPYEVPRALEDGELPAVVQAFASAGRQALQAGFDGVEIHGANGYLLDQFLRDGSNHRQGPYGGTIANRARLLLEVIEAVRRECPLVGLRLSPLNSFNGMIDSDPIALVSSLAPRLNDCGLAYVHLMRSDFLGRQQGDVLTPMRAGYRGVLIANMGYSPVEASEAVSSGAVDAVAFGVAFLANPDLPARIAQGAPLQAPRPDMFYTSGPEGYLDYPTLAPV
jgi:N-ethylmaleimide reductase